MTWATVARLGVVFVVSRLVVSFVALCAIWASNGKQTIYGAFTTWDATWYGLIARDGYPSDVVKRGGGSPWAFFPGWPTLLRLTHAAVGGTWQRNGIIWALVLGFATVVLLYLAVADVLGQDTAFDTVVLSTVAPAAAVLSMVYSEVLFIPCCLACIVLLGRQRWLLAGLAALVGSTTRIGGVALIIVCLVEAAVTFRRTRSLRPFIAPAIAPLGMIAFFVYQRVHAHSWSAYFTGQRFWGNGNSWGLEVLAAFRTLITDGSAWKYPPGVLVPIVVLIAAASAAALYRTPAVPRSWWVLTIILGGLAVSPTLIYSGPRLFLPIFPLAAGAAARIPRRWFPVAVATSAVLMAVVGVLYFNTTATQMAP